MNSASSTCSTTLGRGSGWTRWCAPPASKLRSTAKCSPRELPIIGRKLQESAKLHAAPEERPCSRWPTCYGLAARRVRAADYSDVLGPSGLNLLDKDFRDAGNDNLPDAAATLDDVVAADYRKAAIEFSSTSTGRINRRRYADRFRRGVAGVGVGSGRGRSFAVGLRIHARHWRERRPRFYVDTSLNELLVDWKPRSPA